MNNYITNHFGKQRVVLPVIHVINQKQAMFEIDKCVRAQADGVFLIAMDGRNHELMRTTAEAMIEFPRFWMGVNLLGYSPLDATFHVRDSGIQGFWSDNARLDSLRDAAMTRANFARAGVAHFGGFAFKYQPQPRNLTAAAISAEPMLDVLTTSGNGTGQAPDAAKINTIRAACPEAAIGIASGITPENVHLFGAANAFLSATGLETDFGNLDIKRIKMLVANVRAMNNTTQFINTIGGDK